MSAGTRVYDWRHPAANSQDPTQILEYACHEGNYAMTNILSGARAAEKAAK